MVAAGCIGLLLVASAGSCTSRTKPHQGATAHPPFDHRPSQTEGMSVRAGASTWQSPPRTKQAAPPCTHHFLVVHQVRGQGLNSAEDLLDFEVTNIGPRSCLARRYPIVRFYSAEHRALPFRVQRTKPAPETTRLLLRPRKPADFGLVVWVCLVRPSALATEATFKIPGVRGRYRLTLTGVTLRPNGWPYCGTPRRPDIVGVFPMR